jgi:predicted acylesterase/phospholipase RssA
MFNSIAFGGGGVRGVLHIGGLTALHEIRGHLRFPNGIYGTSIGSVIATAVAFNMTPAQIKTMLYDHFHLQTALPSFRLSNLQEFPVKKGAYDTKAFAKMLQESFQQQGIDLSNKTIGDAPQKLYIFATNLSTGKLTRLTGRVPILEAIQASCALPLVFQPVPIYGQLYVDSCVQTHIMYNSFPEDCLVLHINTPVMKIQADELESLSFYEYLMNIYQMSQETHAGSTNRIWFRNSKVSILQNITKEDKDALFEQGYSDTLAFFAERTAKEREERLG